MGMAIDIQDTAHADAPLSDYLGAPSLGKLRMRPFKAYRHMQALLADKENTEEVFHIIRALNGNAFETAFQDFLAEPEAMDRIAQARTLPPLLDDHERWLKLPEGTFGRTYVDFMRREGLTAQGLVEESLKPAASREFRRTADPLRVWYGDRSRDTHDMFHILTGLGRDALGEACVLAFTYPQHGRGKGLMFISYMGAREVARGVKRHSGRTIPWRAAIRECRRVGYAARKLEAQDLLALFPLPLDEVRERLNIAPATHYRECHRIMGEEGLDPYAMVNT